MEFLFLVCLMKFSIASELSYLYCTEGLNMRRCDPSFHESKERKDSLIRKGSYTAHSPSYIQAGVFHPENIHAFHSEVNGP